MNDLDEQIDSIIDDFRDGKITSINALEQISLLEFPQEYVVATLLHKALCRRDHTDQCGWYYSKYDKNETMQYERKDYIKQAGNFLAEFTFVECIKMCLLLVRRR